MNKAPVSHFILKSMVKNAQSLVAGILVSMGLDKILFDAKGYIDVIPLSAGIVSGINCCLIMKFNVLGSSQT